MPLVFEWFLALAAAVGHFSLAVWLYNRLHSVAWPVRTIKVLERAILLIAAIVLAAGMVRFIWMCGFDLPWAGQVYLLVCWICAALVLPLWLVPKLRQRTPLVLQSNDTQVIDVAQQLGAPPIAGRQTQLLARIPGNQLCQLHVQRKTLRLPRLPRELAGLTIAHLSDLHMLGNLTEAFYAEVVDATNALAPDLVCITGDILEKTACLPWIPRTLGRLSARHGKFFVVGNHELRLPDVAPLRKALTDCGFRDLGSRCELLSLRGSEILLAGTELPWFGTAPPVNARSESGSAPFRVLLSHSPDELAWARANDFDLVLAGHVHGGQIRLPGLGALISPSRFGWRYAGGLYHEPPTVMHVSRGLSGKQAIRLNCPPEIALLVLDA
ncbi:MAG: metallophosphoesterase [Pirellulaceae bacterium]